MAELDNQATGVETGAGAEHSESQGADAGSQDPGQGQDSTHTQVEGDGAGASSARAQERSQNNMGFASQRVIEKNLSKLVSKALKEQLEPFMGRLNPAQPPARNDAGRPAPTLDYNDLPGSISRMVEQRAAEILEEKLGGSLGKFEQSVDQRLGQREARNYLRAQIGTDQEALDKVQDIMEEFKLGYAAIEDPFGAVQVAVKIYKERKGNPNVPTRGQLSTVTNGTVGSGRSKPGVKDIIGLQKKLAGNLSNEEREQVGKQVADLVSSLKE